ncbi:Rieske (2Fe-2S) protein [Pseudonocardia sp. MH-G8]|uniref:Rieske (2Fe-2S) protein n=1 Tax=Pseudonocardia sp. MH-G8 TaxID=1854588 RepID=UPI001E3FC22A|nr:Rieske (2Fe-2S) protein [Pseudonocardia sp. MH-G8]
MLPSAPSRRAFVAGSAGACAAALCACTTYDARPAPPPAPAPAPPSQPDAAGAADALAGASDIPVGGGAVFPDRDVVVTQPTAGRFRAFSATCTHQGCAVGEVREGTIVCTCHGSRFAVEDGAVVEGPADAPLPERAIEVDGDQILLA